MDARASDRGAVYVEFIIAIVPLLVLFWGLLQVNGLLLADLMVRNAAIHAARAAVVCDSDKATSGPSGARDCAQQVADELRPSVHSITAMRVEDVEGASEVGNGPVTVTIAADYQCQVPLVAGFACGVLTGGGGLSSTATLRRKATFTNQGHYYKF
jgi:Flp pilus assembly protein TadG